MIGPLIKTGHGQPAAGKTERLFAQSHANLTYESMMETILGKDGITPEMLKEQQERVQLIERLMQASIADVRSEIIKQNIKLFDEQFFALFSRLAQSATQSGQEPMARALIDLQKQLLEETEFGRQLKESVGELEAATKVLAGGGAKSHARETAGVRHRIHRTMPASALMSAWRAAAWIMCSSNY